MQIWTLYCHTHIESGRRYIGLTSQTMEKRWKTHVHHAKSSKSGRWHFPNAIRKHGPEAFSHEVLEICHDLEVANLAEECWIEFYETRNPEKGFNLAKGGKHVPHSIRKNPWNDPEYREKITKNAQFLQSSRSRAANKAALNTPDSKSKRSLASKEAASKPEFRAKISAAFKGRKTSSEERERLREIARNQVKTPEMIAKISASVKLALSKPEIREKMIKRKMSPGTREKIRLKNIGRRLSEETKAKISAKRTGHVVSEEVRNLISTRQKGKKPGPYVQAGLMRFFEMERARKFVMKVMLS